MISQLLAFISIVRLIKDKLDWHKGKVSKTLILGFQKRRPKKITTNISLLI